jgi:hypothetical protein
MTAVGSRANRKGLAGIAKFFLADHTDDNSASARLEPCANVIVLSLKAPIGMRKTSDQVARERSRESEVARRNRRIAAQSDGERRRLPESDTGNNTYTVPP